MKLQIASDLPLEYAPNWELPAGDADVLVLAGDVAIQTHRLDAFRARARQQPVLYAPGNPCSIAVADGSPRLTFARAVPRCLCADGPVKSARRGYGSGSPVRIKYTIITQPIQYSSATELPAG